ncbi:MAG: hypothetical protein ABS81_21025 [Pseudonocardia sp. SCN 72-86]|nr:MAG: hypothetical protein ABS81_21025 [Pseudonocardia sp. SCN 72-86]
MAGLALLPVTAGLAEAATAAALCALGFDKLHGGSQVAASRRRDLLTGAESGFEVLTPGLVALIEAASILSDVAYVEADYLGRDGRQAAAVWRSGRVEIGPLLLGPTEPFKPAAAPISVALQALGVRGRPENAFLVVGLGQCRRTVDWARLAAEVDEYGDGDGDAR